jgi:soluble lytic murein transglycosylase-like protein
MFLIQSGIIGRQSSRIDNLEEALTFSQTEILTLQTINDTQLDTLIVANDDLQRRTDMLDGKIDILDKVIDSDKKRKVRINVIVNAIRETLPKSGNPLPNCQDSLSNGEVLKIAGAVSDMSEKYSVPVPLILAVIKQESQFCNHAVSSAGARGYMQLMPETATYVAISIDAGLVIWEGRDNIQLGTAYLSNLLSEFHGDLRFAIRAYNAGPVHVKRVIAGETVNFYAETENYYQKVIEYKSVYERLGAI